MAKKIDPNKPPYYHIKTVDIVAKTIDAVLSCYGVIGIADKKQIKGLREIDPKKGKIEEGILVERFPDHTFAVTVHLILAESIKLTETLRESQKRTKYILDKNYPKRCRYVSVYGVGLASINN